VNTNIDKTELRLQIHVKPTRQSTCQPTGIKYASTTMPMHR